MRVRMKSKTMMILESFEITSGDDKLTLRTGRLSGHLLQH